MRFYALLFCSAFFLVACDKHDPILPGVRTSIFNDGLTQNVLNIDVPDLSDDMPNRKESECNYTIDNTNTIRDGERKIFVGFPATNSVDIVVKPVCDDGYAYAGLTTGNVVKVAPSGRRIMWMADVYSESNMMGGAATVDIVAPMVIDGGYIYVGGMGNLFCKINKNTGEKKWCTPIGTMHPFIVLDNVIFVTGLDNALYAIRKTDGAIYWRSGLKDNDAPKYKDKIIVVHKQKFNAVNGDEL